MISHSLAAVAPDPSIYTQLGTASVVAVILSTGCWVLWRALQAERAKFEELLNRALPLLGEAIKLLSTTPDRMNQVLNQAEHATTDGRQRELLRSVEELITAIKDERGK